MKHLIVGNGPAGINAARTLRKIAPQDLVAVVAEEAQPFYSKVLTSYFVGGKVPYENVLLANAEQFQDQSIQLLTGKQAVRVDSAAKELLLSGGEKVQYDRLLLATGAAPFIPPIEGIQLPGVFTLWTHDDAVNMKAWIQPGQKALVVGAGLVGLKAAEAFLMKGLSVTVVELLDRVLPQVLTLEDAALVRKALAKKGLTVRTGTAVTRISGNEKVQQATLSDGSVLDCDLVVVATGVRPNLSLAKSAGASIGRGILVDEFMQTSVPDLFAAGDVTEGWDAARGRKMPNPTWGNAAEQGRIAACNMAGNRKPFNGAVTLNTFTFLGFSMAAVGITQPDGDYLKVESYSDPRTGDYRKLVMVGDRLVGAVAIGDIRMAGVWRGLIARKGPSAPTAEALMPRKTNFAWTHGFTPG
ncbi:MAG: NAD(P)/FAD-dependent oxidoreductase, partial [Chloroflexota bacterium]